MVPADVRAFCWPQLLGAGAESQLLQHLHVTQKNSLQEARERRLFPVMGGLSQQGLHSMATDGRVVAIGSHHVFECCELPGVYIL